MTTSSLGRAQNIIRHPGDHPNYMVEIEPHVLYGAFDPPGTAYGSGPGLGVRFTIPIVDVGFLDRINDSLGIGFGLDWVHYHGGGVNVGPCAHYEPGLAGTSICTEVAGPYGGPADYFYIPGVLQWNFWFTPKLSAFGEGGFAIYHEKAQYDPNSHLGLIPTLAVGGRYQFTDKVALTVRLGYPTLSLGVSFLP